MTKSQLLGIFRTKQNQIKLAYASLFLWAYPDTPGYFRALRSAITEVPDVFPDICHLLDDEVALKLACVEIYDSAHRSAINELFIFTKKYCYDTRQIDLIKSEPWFQLWRIIRNCWAHHMRFCFSAEEKAMLPISWSGVIITLEMNGKPLTHGHCSREKLRELLEEASSFISRELA